MCCGRLRLGQNAGVGPAFRSRLPNPADMWILRQHARVAWLRLGSSPGPTAAPDPPGTARRCGSLVQRLASLLTSSVGGCSIADFLLTGAGGVAGAGCAAWGGAVPCRGGGAGRLPGRPAGAGGGRDADQARQAARHHGARGPLSVLVISVSSSSPSNEIIFLLYQMSFFRNFHYSHAAPRRPRSPAAMCCRARLGPCGLKSGAQARVGWQAVSRVLHARHVHACCPTMAWPATRPCMVCDESTSSPGAGVAVRGLPRAAAGPYRPPLRRSARRGPLRHTTCRTRCPRSP